MCEPVAPVGGGAYGSRLSAEYARNQRPSASPCDLERPGSASACDFAAARRASLMKRSAVGDVQRGTVMKVILVLLLLLAGGGLLMYYGGGYEDLDPSQQGRDARERIQRGMSWEEVIDVTKAPRKYTKMIVTGVVGAGEEMELVKRGPKLKFDPARVTARLEKGELPHGFVFDYRYSESVAFSVSFDAEGNVVAVDKMTTMHDLLQYDDE